MILRDIENRLDMMCNISLRLNAPWLSIVENLKLTYPVQIERSGRSTKINVCVDRSRLPATAETLIAGSSSAVKKKSYYSVTEEIEDASAAELVSGVMKLNSSISTGAYLQGRFLSIPFRFHSSSIDEVNSLLSAVPDTGRDARVSYLGKSPGLSYMLNYISEIIPLTAIRYHIPGKGSGSFFSKQMEAGVQFIAEVEKNHTRSTGYRMLLYTERDADLKLRPISEEDRIYDIEVNRELPEIMTKLSDSERILRPSVMLRVVDGMLEVTTFVPSSEALSYVKLLYSALLGSGGEKPVVSLFSPLKTTMFQWL